jgi:hypothetical protein
MLALAEYVGSVRAWWWSLGFLFSTGFLAYVKGTWDILVAATAVAFICWLVARAYRGRDDPRVSLYGIAVGVGVAALSRYSMLPFLVLAAASALLPLRRSLPTKHVVGAGFVFVVLLLPDFIFNEMRSGQVWNPGHAAPQFGGSPALTADYVFSIPAMFFGIDRGLLFYAPFCLLGFGTTILLTVKARGLARWAFIGCLIAAVAYAIGVNIAHEWRVFGWGPRYLVPLLPALFVIGAISVDRRLVPRALGYGALALGLLTQVPLLTANWHAVVTVVDRDHRAPNAIIGLWRSSIDGVLHGRGFGEVADLRGLDSPDTWWWHLAPSVTHLVGLFLLAVFLGGFAMAGHWAMRGAAEMSAAPPSAQ